MNIRFLDRDLSPFLTLTVAPPLVGDGDCWTVRSGPVPPAAEAGLAAPDHPSEGPMVRKSPAGRAVRPASSQRSIYRKNQLLFWAIKKECHPLHAERSWPWAMGLSDKRPQSLSGGIPYIQNTVYRIGEGVYII